MKGLIILVAIMSVVGLISDYAVSLDPHGAFSTGLALGVVGTVGYWIVATWEERSQ